MNSKKQEAAEAITLGLKGKLALTRLTAAKALGETGICPSLKDLLECLKDDDPDVRIDVAEALGKIGDKGAVAALLEATKDIQGVVVINAVKSFGQICDDTDNQVVDRLIELLGEEDVEYAADEDFDDDEYDFDPQYDVHLEAVNALGKIGTPKAIDPLIKYLKDEETQDITESILRALSKIKDDASADALIQLLSNSDNLLRKRTAAALGNMNYPKVIEALTNALLDKDADVRINAARSLVKTGGLQNIVPLALLLKDQDTEVRAEVTGLFGEIDDPRVVEHLLPMLKDSAVNVRKKAAEALGKTRNSEAVDPLIELLKDPNEAVMCEAVVALGKIGDKKALEPLFSVAKNKQRDVYLRINAINAIGMTGGAEILEVLKECVQDDEKQIILSAMATLEKTGLPEALSIITSVFEEDEEVEKDEEDEKNGDETEDSDAVKEELEDKAETKEEADAGDKPGEDDNVDEVADGEKDDDDQEKAVEKADEIKDDESKKKQEEERRKLELDKYRKIFAVRILGKASTKEANASIASLLESDDLELIREAIVSLGNLEKKELFSSIAPFLSHEVSAIKFAAIEALGKIKNEEAVEPLCEIVNTEKEPFVRLPAVRALGQVGSSKAVDVLIKSMKDEAMEVRREIIISLGLLKDAKAIEALLDALYDFEYFGDLRNEVAKSLKNIDDTIIIDKLVGTVKDDKQTGNHWVAMEALTEIYRKAA